MSELDQLKKEAREEFEKEFWDTPNGRFKSQYSIDVMTGFLAEYIDKATQAERKRCIAIMQSYFNQQKPEGRNMSTIIAQAIEKGEEV